MVLIANIISILAATLMVISGYIKSKKTCLILQTTQICITIIVNLMLHAISAGIVNIISIFRNVLCYKNKLTLPYKLAICVVSTALVIIFDRDSAIWYLPIVATVAYTLFLDRVNDIQFKWLTIGTMILWNIYDVLTKAYVFAAFDFAFIITNFIGLYRLCKDERFTKNHQ
jgi:hypothetical protein